MKRVLAVLIAVAVALLVGYYATRNDSTNQLSVEPSVADIAAKPTTVERPEVAIESPVVSETAEGINSSNTRQAIVDPPRPTLVATPLRGVLVDSQTRSPIPEFLIKVGSSRESETVMTNRQGRFVTQTKFATGDISLLLLDRPAKGASSIADQPARLTHKHVVAQSEPEPEPIFETTTGPTYEIAVTLPAGTTEDDFFATFPAPTTGGSQSMHAAISEDPNSPLASYMGAAVDPSALEVRASLRTGEPRWVRFRAPLVDPGALLGDHDRHELQLRSYDGHWAGGKLVKSVEGVYPTTMSIQLTERGAFDGVVVSDTDRQAVPSAWIRVATSHDPEHAVAEIGADRLGHFSFQWLPADDYELTITTSRFREWTTNVGLGAGETKKIEARLSSSVQLGTISGVLRSRTGHHRSKGAIVMLRGVDDPKFGLFKNSDYREVDGQFVAPFSFDKVPSGAYHLSINPLDNMRWNTRTLTVTVPSASIEFICEDESPTFDLAFEAVDAATGESLSKTWTIVWQGNESDDIRLDCDFESGHYLGVPEDTPIRWMLRAEGYRMVWGDATKLDIDGKLRTARTRLVRGWGQIFLVTTPNRDPIAGVELLADGAHIGTTDSRGIVMLDLDRKPERLEFVRAGLKVSWGSVDPTKDDFGWEPETPVYLSPDH